MAERVRALFEERPTLSRTLFLVYGSNEGSAVTTRVPELADVIRRDSPQTFSLGVERVPDGGHVPESGLADGLRFIFTASPGGLP
jgi:hypothetical protein